MLLRHGTRPPRRDSGGAVKLYNYFRSGTSHRLRIALNLKGVVTDYVAVNLLAEENLQDEFATINPQRLVPALDTGSQMLIQTPAIIEWLEEMYPDPPLLPADVGERAFVRALAAVIGNDVHPLNNRRVLQYLRHHFAADGTAIDAWCAQWIEPGLDTYAALLTQRTRSGTYSCGSQPTIADIYLVPQLVSARRFKVDLARWPALLDIEAACLELEAFRFAAPDAQSDAPRPVSK